MWSKGAVVIIKHGDEEMADSMANSLVPVKKKKKRDALPRRDPEYWNHELAVADFIYGKNYRDPPKWLKPAIGFYALVVYGISITFEKISKMIFH